MLHLQRFKNLWSQDFEKVKDELIKLIKLALAVFESVKRCADFDETINFGCVIMSTRGEMM